MLQRTGRRKSRTTAVNAGVAGVSQNTVSRYGAAIKEHLVAYDGVDPEANANLKRSLEKISKYKRPASSDPNYSRLTKSQAGFSAEVKSTARKRAEQAISGKKPHTVRTDDVPDHVNDPLFDITSKVDSKGNPVPAASVQVKFIGSSPKDAVTKMLGGGGNFRKYDENNVKIEVPSDYYDGMKADLKTRITSLRKQCQHLEKQNDSKTLAGKRAELDRCRRLNKNLRKSNTSSEEAIQARNHPVWSTTKDVLKVAHRAGWKQAGIGAGIGGGVSLVRNIMECVQGEKTPEEAALAVTGDTAAAAAGAYSVTFVASAFKGFLQKAESPLLRIISKSNLPTYLVTTTLEIGKTMFSYFKGEIDTVECLDELGEKGYGMLNSALYAGIGQIMIPIPILGALAGSIFGYALSAVSYHSLLDSLKDAKLAHEERLRIEKESKEAVAMLQSYRAELEEKIQQVFSNRRQFFDSVFDQMKNALQIDDPNGYISAVNRITERCGKEPLFRNTEEFDELMENPDVPIRI